MQRGYRYRRDYCPTRRHRARSRRSGVEGWEHYLRDGQETNINSLNPEMGTDILAYGVEESAALVLDPVASEKGLGHMSSARWNELHKQMVEAGLIKAEGGVEGAFDTQFLR